MRVHTEHCDCRWIVHFINKIIINWNIFIFLLNHRISQSIEERQAVVWGSQLKVMDFEIDFSLYNRHTHINRFYLYDFFMAQ